MAIYTMLHIMTFGAGDLSRFEHLKASAELCKMNIQYITRTEYKGFYEKIKYTLEAIESLPDSDIVCFVDGFDVLAIGTEAAIIHKFLSYECDLLFGAELNCWPGEYKGRYPDMGIPNGYKYLNSGGIIGYVHALKALYTWKDSVEMETICNNNNEGDQAYCIKYFLENKPTKNIQLDWRQSIFQNMFSVDWNELYIQDARVVNTLTHQTPCFLHFNGCSYEARWRVNIMPHLVKTLRYSAATPGEHYAFSMLPQNFYEHYWKRSQI